MMDGSLRTTKWCHPVTRNYVDTFISGVTSSDNPDAIFITTPTCQIGKTAYGAIVIDLEIACATRPELMQTAVRATVTKIGPDVGPKGGITAGDFGRRDGTLETRDHLGALPVCAAIVSAREDRDG